MFKKVIATSLVVSTLIFSGCGDSDGESRLETQNMLDKGDYLGVINKLKGNASSDDDYIALASAYMGKAGYSILEIASAMSKDDDSDSDDNPMKKIVGDDKPSSSVSDLSKAAEYYKKVVGNNTCNKKKNDENNITLDTNQKDVCLFVSLSAVAKTATTLNLLADDMSAFSSSDKSDTNTTDYKLSASGCAMQFAFDNNLTSMKTKDCDITLLTEDVKFTLVNRIYRPIEVHVNKDTNSSNIYHFMLTQEDNLTHTRSTALTKDYCTKESFTRFKEYNSSLYACPVNEDPDLNETTSVGVLKDTLNGDIDAILSAVPKDEDGEDKDIGENEINEFKCDVISGTFNDKDKTCTDDQNTTVDFADRNITDAEIINYMSTRNEEKN